MMIPLHYVAGKDCKNLADVLVAFYDKYPETSLFLAFLIVLFVEFTCLVTYQVLKHPDF